MKFYKKSHNFYLDKIRQTVLALLNLDGQTDMTILIGVSFNDSLECTKITEAVIRTKDSGDLVQKLNTKHSSCFVTRLQHVTKK